jgi:transposase
MGDPTLRTLLVLGAAAVLGHARRGVPVPARVASLVVRRPFKVAAVALAKDGADGPGLPARGGEYRRPAAAAPAT